jgi:hypothetical protein
MVAFQVHEMQRALTTIHGRGPWQYVKPNIEAVFSNLTNPDILEQRIWAPNADLRRFKDKLPIKTNLHFLVQTIFHPLGL